jgi:hypothetical protein
VRHTAPRTFSEVRQASRRRSCSPPPRLDSGSRTSRSTRPSRAHPAWAPPGASWSQVGGGCRARFAPRCSAGPSAAPADTSSCAAGNAAADPPREPSTAAQRQHAAGKARQRCWLLASRGCPRPRCRLPPSPASPSLQLHAPSRPAASTSRRAPRPAAAQHGDEQPAATRLLDFEPAAPHSRLQTPLRVSVGRPKAAPVAARLDFGSGATEQQEQERGSDSGSGCETPEHELPAARPGAVLPCISPVESASSPEPEACAQGGGSRSWHRPSPRLPPPAAHRTCSARPLAQRSGT